MLAGQGAGAAGVRRRGPEGQAAHATSAPGWWARGVTGVLPFCRLRCGAGGIGVAVPLLAWAVFVAWATEVFVREHSWSQAGVSAWSAALASAVVVGEEGR
jgi:hypothetical protein